ncbi:unnamed protein product [Coregonus sp. 'balchen']|nr:unnamed protein product [Coregonus sp. 'balchen']
MAGSRLEKFGTVFTRDLMRSGVVKQSDKPIWYDVYKTFPPKKDTLYVRQWPRSMGRKKMLCLTSSTERMKSERKLMKRFALKFLLPFKSC